MRRAFASALIAGLGLGLAGCGETSKVETEKTISTPEGSKTIKETSEVTDKGSNPPPATTTEPPAK